MTEKEIKGVQKLTDEETEQVNGGFEEVNPYPYPSNTPTFFFKFICEKCGKECKDPDELRAHQHQCYGKK